MQNQDRHLPFLDSFRGIAILAVIVIHYFGPLTEHAMNVAAEAHSKMLHLLFKLMFALCNLGSFGVAIFFIVSGFCIHLSYRRSQDAGWLVFFTRRVFRIVPAYWFTLFVVMLLPASRPHDDPTSFPAQTIDAVLHFFLAHNFLPQTFTTLNIAFWSLSIEFQLYLLFPLLLIVTRRIGWAQTLVVTAFVEFVSRLTLSLIGYHETQIFPPLWWGWNKLSPFAFWFSWSLGALLAEAFVENKPIPFAKGPLPLWAWPLLVLALDHIPFLRNFGFPIAALGTACAMAYFLSRDHSMPQLKPSPTVKVLNFIGVISYSIYLLHWPINRLALSFCPKDFSLASNIAIRFAVSAASIVPALIMSYLLYRLVELPGIDLGKTVVKWIRRQNAPIVNLT